MLTVKHISNAKMFYRNYADTSCININVDSAGVNVNYEMTVSEAERLIDELTDIVEWIKS